MAIHLQKQLFALFSAAYQGLMLYGGSEEAMYLLRLQQGLRHPFADTTNGVWSTANAPSGMQMAGLEKVLGILFGWTGVNAPVLTFILNAVTAPLILVLIVLLARRFGIPRLASLLSGIAFFWVISYGKRYFHPGFSLPLTLAAFLLLDEWWKRPQVIPSILAGILMGFLTGVYFWSWTFIWAVSGVLFLIALTLSDRLRRRRVQTFIVMMIAAIVAASPTFLSMLAASRHPFFQETSVRVGLAMTHALESPRRSLLILISAICVCISFAPQKKLRDTYALLIAGWVAMLVAFNQQLIHGRVISYSSHYEQYVCVLALLTIVVFSVHFFARQRWTIEGFVASACGLLLLYGAYVDYGGKWTNLLPPTHAEAAALQYLGPAIRFLNTQPKQTILANLMPSDLIAEYTDHDVVFTEYTEIILISDQEYRERYCLSQAFSPDALPIDKLVVYAEERLRVLRHQETEQMLQHNLSVMQSTCAQVKKDPVTYLKKYGVTQLFWDQKSDPRWQIDQKLFTLEKQGEGWSIWRHGA